MISNALDRISFWSLFITITFLPFFFLPFSKVPVETSKGLLLVAGLAVSIIFWTAARFSGGKIVMPRSWTMLAGLGVVVAFLASAIFSSARQVSLFGIMFDISSFWFIFAAFLLMFVSSIVLHDRERAKMVLLGVMASSLVVFLFQILRLFAPNTLSLGILSAKTDNIFGSWNALGLFAGFTAIMSLFLVEFFAVPRRLKRILGFLILFAVILLAVINFALVWKIVGIFSLIIFVYKVSMYSINRTPEGKTKGFPTYALGLVMVSLLFFMAGQFIGPILPNKLGITNIEISPSFQATMSVTRAELAHDPVFGIGPNRFPEVWAKNKSASVNATQFWDTSFNSGSGLLPSFASTTGILGILAWVAFLVLFVLLGVKYLFSNIKNNVGQEMSAFFIASLFLFISAFFYSVGPVLFLLAFAFSGVFIGLASASRANGEIVLTFLDDPRKSFFSILFLVIVMIVTAAAGFKYMERFASVPFFGRAVAATSVADAETDITRANTLYTNDLYLRTLAQVYLIKMNSLASKGSSLSDQDKSDLQTSFNQALAGAQAAVNYNPSNYLNQNALGAVYETVVPLGVTGAYDKAVAAYQAAAALDPLSPGIKLALARVALTDQKYKDAQDYANQALQLKSDYIDAYILLSQIAKAQGDNTSALNYANQALSFAPTNQSLIQYVNSLKGGGSASAPAAAPSTENSSGGSKKSQ